jgi:glycosyltransferase involved in cell wall biosynthesis
VKAILSSNVPHYHYAARALADERWLCRYICGVVPRFDPLDRVLPPFWRRKLEGRRLPQLPGAKVTSLVVPELAQKAASHLHAMSPERSVRLQNELFDRLAAARVGACDAFHFVSSIGLVSARRAKRRGAVVICDERAEHPAAQRRALAAEYDALGLPFKPHVAIWEDRVSREYELSDHLFVGSAYSKETYVEAGLPTDRIWVVPYGFEPTIFAPAAHAQVDVDGGLRVLFCGQLTPRKGIHRLVAAFERAAPPKATLRLVGPVDPVVAHDVRRWAEVPGIEVIGEVPKLELPVHYGWASVFVLPAVADAQPLACLEAMASGLPAIVTTAMGSREIVRDGIDGFVVAPSDEEAIAERLTRLDADRDLLSAQRQSALQRAAEFTWEAYERRFVSTYRQIFS